MDSRTYSGPGESRGGRKIEKKLEGRMMTHGSTDVTGMESPSKGFGSLITCIYGTRDVM
jgi:hypothetical protein